MYIATPHFLLRLFCFFNYVLSHSVPVKSVCVKSTSIFSGICQTPQVASWHYTLICLAQSSKELDSARRSEQHVGKGSKSRPTEELVQRERGQQV